MRQLTVSAAALLVEIEHNMNPRVLQACCMLRVACCVLQRMLHTRRMLHASPHVACFTACCMRVTCCMFLVHAACGDGCGAHHERTAPACTDGQRDHRHLHLAPVCRRRRLPLSAAGNAATQVSIQCPVQRSAAQCSAAQCSAVQRSAAQCSAAQRSAAQCSAVPALHRIAHPTEAALFLRLCKLRTRPVGSRGQPCRQVQLGRSNPPRQYAAPIDCAAVCATNCSRNRSAQQRCGRAQTHSVDNSMPFERHPVGLSFADCRCT